MSALRWVWLATLLPGCVERNVESPLIGLGDSAGTHGKESSPGIDSMDPAPEETEAGTDGPKGDPSDATSSEASSGSDDSSSGEPAADVSTGDPPDDASTTGDPPTPGDPMWTHCSQDDDCESAMCLGLQVDGSIVDAYCSDDCTDPTSDCAAPDSGSAQRICMTADAGQSVCALQCSETAACPDSMVCYQVNPSLNLCF